MLQSRRVRNFAGDTNLIIKNKSANKISLNAKKTELLIFRSK